MYLRRIRDDDLGAIFRMRNDIEIYKWCRQNAPLHWENHLQWYNCQAKDPKISMFAIMPDSSSSELAGICGLTDIDLVNGRAEFSLYISRKFQRSGLGQKSLIALFKHGFYDLRLNLIWGETFEKNPALNLFTKKLNMKIDGIRRDFYYRDGHHINAFLISICYDEFSITEAI